MSLQAQNITATLYYHFFAIFFCALKNLLILLYFSLSSAKALAPRRSKICFDFFVQKHSPASLLLLILLTKALPLRKPISHTEHLNCSAHLFGCKHLHNGLLTIPNFCGIKCFMPPLISLFLVNFYKNTADLRPKYPSRVFLFHNGSRQTLILKKKIRRKEKTAHGRFSVFWYMCISVRNAFYSNFIY